MNILWIPHAPWHVPQREKYLLKYLAKNHRVFATDWDTDFRSPRDYLTKRYVRNIAPRQYRDEDVTVYHIPRFSPALFFPTIQRYNEKIYGQWVERIVDKHQIDWVVGSFVLPYRNLGVPVTIDVGDDNVAYWQEGGGRQEYTEVIRANEDSWLNNSQYVSAISSVLCERLEMRLVDHRKLMLVIPNGVDLGAYAPPEDKAAVKTLLGLNPRYRYIGCIGSFNRKGEVERLIRVAREIQNISSAQLLIVGAGKYLPEMQRQLKREHLPNVIFAGFQEGMRLLQYFQAIDVGLCPYPVTYGLHASSPLRLLQYSAVGATVVIPNLKTVQRMAFENVVFSDESDEGFAKTARLALDLPGRVPSTIRSYDWAALAERWASPMEIAAARGYR